MIQCSSVLSGRLLTSEADTDIDYEEVRRLLVDSELSPSPGEAHGILCGLICGGDPQPSRTWLDQVLPDSGPLAGGPSTGQARAELAQLAEQTLEEIEGPGLGLTLLVPDDSGPLAERARALYDWIRGFLFALGILGIGEAELSEQTREIFHDFSDLTRLDLEALEEGEENEAALTEVTEFVWVAAMLLYHERVLDASERAASQ